MQRTQGQVSAEGISETRLDQDQTHQRIESIPDFATWFCGSQTSRFRTLCQEESLCGEAQNSQELKAPCAPSKVRHAHLESEGRAPSKCTPCTSESACHAHESYHINSSNSHRHLFSLSNSADALLEREKPYPHQGVGKEEDNQEEPFFVTNPKKSAGIITPLEAAGDALRFPPPARPGPEAQKYPCPCGFTHPPGMPSLEEIRVELRKLHPEPEYLDIWVADDVERLHDTWLANGFQMKNGPIKNWRASLRNWERWQKEH
jgi:hypothetical protein